MTAQMERLDRVVICFHFSNFEPLETAEVEREYYDKQL